MTCKKCGSRIDSNAKICNACGASVSNQKKKKKKSHKLISFLLIIALIAGGAFLFYKNIPSVKVYDAIQNTLFNSSEYDIIIKISENDNDDEFTQTNIKLTLGEDVNSSILEMTFTEKYLYTNLDSDTEQEPTIYEDTHTLSIKNGTYYYDDVAQLEMTEFFDSLESDLSYYTDEEVDIAKEIDNLINGKIDEAALEKLYNATIAPILEEIIKESSGESVELPDYKEIMGKSGTMSELFKKNKDVKNALALKMIKSEQPGTTYEYCIDMGALAQAVLDYAMENEQYMSYLEAVVNYSDSYNDVDELVDSLVDEFKDFEDLEGTITVKSNRVTHFTLKDGDQTIEVSINSKK